MAREKTLQAPVDAKLATRVAKETKRIRTSEAGVIRRALRFYFAAVDHEINLEIADTLLEQGAFHA